MLVSGRFSSSLQNSEQFVTLPVFLGLKCTRQQISILRPGYTASMICVVLRKQGPSQCKHSSSPRMHLVTVFTDSASPSCSQIQKKNAMAFK